MIEIINKKNVTRFCNRSQSEKKQKKMRVDEHIFPENNSLNDNARASGFIDEN